MPSLSELSPQLAAAVLAVHLAVIAFNVAWLLVVPAGAAFGWRWVRAFWWRALHLASLAAVAAQAALGRACFLTDWQDALAGGGAHDPLIMRWVNGVIYWPLPQWAFAAAYAVVFAYALALWRFVPPRRKRRERA
jgi:hypothetical protein